ncbi:MAG: glycosyltransferase family A protein [bacterium]|nr:glycosyltransferase family A protein [bacterium]
MLNPKVSIIVPCFNQAQYLDEAIQSVLDQNYTNWECIIINDGSTDNTEEIAQKWTSKEKKIIYLYKENGGLSSSRNFGIIHATGKFILPLDADDKIANNYVNLAIESFQVDDSLKLVYCKAEKFEDETGALFLPPFSLLNLSCNNIIFCSAFFRKEDWELVGGYDEKMIYGLEDWEFWIAILKKGGNVKCLNEICFYYRIKNNSMVRQLNKEKRKYLFEYMSIKHSDFFVQQLGSFIELKDTAMKAKEGNPNKLKSKKFVIDIFLKTFFGFSIFGKLK